MFYVILPYPYFIKTVVFIFTDEILSEICLRGLKLLLGRDSLRTVYSFSSMLILFTQN